MTPVAQLLKGLQDETIDAGFTLFHDEGKGYVADAVWEDGLAVAMPVRHQLMIHKRVPMADALQCPLIVCHPESCQGGYAYIEAVFAAAKAHPIVAEHVPGHESMLMLIGAGLGIGFAIDSQIAHFQRPDVAVRLMEPGLPPLTTYLLHASAKPSPQLERSIERARRVGGLMTTDGGEEQ